MISGKGVLGTCHSNACIVAMLAALMLAEPAQAATLYSTGFEPPTFTQGNLHGQGGWTVDTGSAMVTGAQARSGVQSARVVAGGEVSRAFSVGNQQVIWVEAYVQATPAVDPQIPTTPRSAALFVDSVLGVMLLNGNGSGGGTWVLTGVFPPPNSWFRVSIRLDFAAKKWDCFINGNLGASNLGFHSNSVTTFNGMTIRAQATGDSYVDDVLITDAVGAPIPDFDQDGLADVIEGNPPPAGRTNRYLPDSDGDGLDDGVEDANRNGVFDVGETNGRNRDTDNDGIWDGIEVLLIGSNPTNPADPGPLADADNDGLPDLFDLMAPNNPDGDGDGYKDGYEAVMISLEAAFNPALYPPLGDVNNDGFVTNVDALVTQSLFLGLAQPTSFPKIIWSDVNRDANITNVDALVIQSRFLGLLTSLPI